MAKKLEPKKFKSKKEEFLYLLEEVLEDISADLEMQMFEKTKDLPSDQRDRHLCATSAASSVSMDLLRIVAKSFRRIYGLSTTKCCDECEKRRKQWETRDFNGGLDLYAKEYLCLEDKERFPDAN